ncbi:hypothetical protein B5S28_g1699 [[Candida] boidinii]|uniref:Unnamed protein product n=1 Tax=Candida boidinii TaxID=5477 RepID=A0ACB5UAY6_CANBO|nr:hypothetical protein B5S28_g1699 [[Candida] boidinii]OWB63031.1 hypothetical protein B5S29_g3984 [[Candida] boidinii]OWB74214.1 hypothetical protein B5S31_g3998 [[Candida] boidinii]OWB78940.1 hypothetical protein B5S32_g3146 [[Candida] boidinii]GME95359.1 unnamed protein product [[Candida] boidinii]
MKVTLNNWYAVYSWQWDVPDDELCGICRVSFDGTCPTCKYPGDGCPLVIGECQHAFHMHCIWKWLETETSKGLCPMCRQTFNLDSEKLVNKGIKMHNHSQYFQQSNLETDGDDIDGDGTGDVDADVDGDGDNGERASIMTSASNIEMREAIRNGESGD